MSRCRHEECGAFGAFLFSVAALALWAYIATHANDQQNKEILALRQHVAPIAEHVCVFPN
jgi:hypothetical protein